jgi:RNA polymerase sigma-70 factor, ECF subfamily
LAATPEFSPSITSSIKPRAGIEYEAEFEAVFLEYYERVLGILIRLAGNRAQAEELANEVFWRLSRKPAAWLLTNNVGGWLYRTATHAAIDASRAANHRRRYERNAALIGQQNENAPAAPLADLLRQESRRTVRGVLSRMKPAQAQILLMRAGGSSYKELAEALNVAAGRVGTLLNRAEMEFRKRYLKVTEKEEKRLIA